MTLGISRHRAGEGGLQPVAPQTEPDRDSTVDVVPTVRREALEAIRRVCLAEHERALVIVAPEGSGKTRLLRRAAADPRLGAELMRVSAAESQWATSGLSFLLPLWPIRTAESLVDRLRSCSEDEAYAVANEMVAALRGSIERKVLLVDDLHQMDSTSLVAVAIILRRLRRTGLRVVATVSSLAPDGPLAGLPTMTLPPLDARQSIEIAREHSGGRHPEWVLLRAAHVGGGSAAGVVEALPGPGEIVEPPWCPPRLGAVSARAVDQRLSSLSPGAVDVLRSMSLARCTPEGLSALPRDAVDELLHAGVIDHHMGMLSIRDPRQRAVLYWRMSPAERTRRHETLARTATGVHEPTVVWHSSFLAEPPCADDLLAAAGAWTTGHQRSAALELVERAAALGPLGETSSGALLDVAESLCDVGVLGDAIRVADLASSGSEDPTVRLRATIVRVRSASMVPSDTLAALVDAFVKVADDVDAELTARLLHIACFHASELGDAGRARSWWSRVDRVIGECARRTRARHAVLGDHLGMARPDDPGEICPVGPSPTREEQVDLLLAGRGQSNRERYDQAREVFDALSGLSGLSPVIRGSLPLLALENECRAGNFDRARDAAGQVFVLDEPHEALDAFHAGVLAVHWTLDERPDLAGEYIERVMGPPARFAESPLQAKVRAALGRVHLDQGDVDEARRLLVQADRDAKAIANPLLVRHDGDLVEAMVALGDREAAREVLLRFQRRQRSHPSRWGALVLGRSQAMLLDGPRSVAALRGVLAAWPSGVGGVTYAYEYARTETALAQRLEQLGDHISARDHWGRAVRFMDGVGHRARAQSLRSRYLDDRVTSDDRSEAVALLAGLGRLSDSEREVVERVLAGARNREIADALFVSLRTVESRLTSSYRKLNVRSRAELMALYLSGRGPDEVSGCGKPQTSKG